MRAWVALPSSFLAGSWAARPGRSRQATPPASRTARNGFRGAMDGTSLGTSGMGMIRGPLYQGGRSLSNKAPNGRRMELDRQDARSAKEDGERIVPQNGSIRLFLGAP